MSYTKEQTESAIEILCGILEPGATVYTALRSVAPNGMSRHITVAVPLKRNDGSLYIRNITNLVGRAIGYRVSDKTEALVVGGTGMDMGFHVVYGLSRTLFPNGARCTGKGCHSNDHFNDYGRLSREYDAAHPEENEASERRNGATQEQVEHYVSARQTWIHEQEAACYSRKRVHQDGGYTLSQAWI